MKSSDEILNELKTVAPGLINIGRINIFNIPNNYFNSLISRILIKIFSENQTFKVPEGYFDSFSGRVMEKIRETEETDNLGNSLLLASLKNKNVFTVPQGYFENIGIEEIMTKKQGAVIKPMFHKRKMWKQAVAAVVTGVIAINAMWVFNQTKDQSNYGIENSEISTYIHASNEFKSEEQLNEGISKLSNEDIIKYLSSNGSESDNENLISGLGDSEISPQSLSPAENVGNNLNTQK